MPASAISSNNAASGNTLAQGLNPLPGEGDSGLPHAQLPDTEDIIIRARDLKKQFTGRDILRGVSFDVRRGEVLGILGGNGAGKTTIANILTGRIAPDQGSVEWRLGNRRLIWESAAEWDKAESPVAYFPGTETVLEYLPARKMLTHTAKKRGALAAEADARTEAWLRRTELVDFAEVPFLQLSRGNQQKLLFAVSIIHQPKVLYLDEPFIGLDPLNQERFVEWINILRREGVTVILSDHNLTLVERLADRVCLLQEGRVVEGGTVEEIRQRGDVDTSIYVTFWPESKETPEAIRTRLTHPGIRAVEKTPSGQFRLVIHDGYSVDSILRTIQAGFTVREIAVVQPSLHDLYIRAVRMDERA